MATFYERAAATALRLIKTKGRSDLTLTKRGTDAVFDPVAGKMTTPGTPVGGLIDCVVLPHSAGEVREMGGGDNTYMEDFIRGKLRKLLVAASSCPFEPEAGNEVGMLESATWEVLGSIPLSPAGTPVIYTMTVRKK